MGAVRRNIPRKKVVQTEHRGPWCWGLEVEKISVCIIEFESFSLLSLKSIDSTNLYGLLPVKWYKELGIQ